MWAQTPVAVGADRPTAGRASVVQGVYGSRGNLELVVPDAADGIWVFWFNADLPGDPGASADVPPGTWSAGLRFAEGARYREAVILQSTLGPDHLEVLAVTDGGALESWWWSPGPGFQRRSGVVAEDVVRVAAEHEGGSVRVSIEAASGAVRHLVSAADPYPDRTWRAAESGPGLHDGSAAEHLLADEGITAVDPDSASSAPSDRDGGTLELTWRSDGALVHSGLPAASA